MRIKEVEALNLVVPTKVDKKPISLAYDEHLKKSSSIVTNPPS